MVGSRGFHSCVMDVGLESPRAAFEGNTIIAQKLTFLLALMHAARNPQWP